MRKIMIPDVVKGYEAPLHGSIAPFNIMAQFHHKPDILSHRAAGEQHEIFRKREIRLVFDNPGVSAWRVLLLETLQLRIALPTIRNPE